MDLFHVEVGTVGGDSSLFSVSSWQVLLGATLGSSLRIVDGECWRRIRGLLRPVAAAKLVCRSWSNGKQRRRGAMLTASNGPAGIRRPPSLAWSTEADEIRGSKDDARGGAPGFDERRTWLEHGGEGKWAEARSRDDGGRCQPGNLRRDSTEDEWRRAIWGSQGGSGGRGLGR